MFVKTIKIKKIIKKNKIKYLLAYSNKKKNKKKKINSGISVYGDRTDNNRELKNHDGVHDDDVC